MQVSEIITRVRSYLDEADSHDVEVLSGSAPVDDRIRVLIPECCVIYSSGVQMSEEVLSTFAVEENGVGTMDVPTDYIRLYELKLSCWKNSVRMAISHETPRYTRQQSIVTRGGVTRPIVAIVPHGESRRFEMYSIPMWDSRVEIERALYVPKVIIESDSDDIAIEMRYENALCYMIAGRVARNYGHVDAANILQASLEEELTLLRQN